MQKKTVAEYFLAVQSVSLPKMPSDCFNRELNGQ